MGKLEPRTVSLHQVVFPACLVMHSFFLATILNCVIFRCAGIHRNLGVHISKVKSVNLDSWTPQQVAVGFQTDVASG